MTLAPGRGSPRPGVSDFWGAQRVWNGRLRRFDPMHLPPGQACYIVAPASTPEARWSSGVKIGIVGQKSLGLSKRQQGGVCGQENGLGQGRVNQGLTCDQR